MKDLFFYTENTTEKEIIKEYNRIIDSNYGSIGRNLYTCENGHQILTTHINKGVTPFIIFCPECKKEATSHFYRISQNGQLYTSHKVEIPKRVFPDNFDWWIRPSLQWVLNTHNKKNKTPLLCAYIEHILRGGLVLKTNFEKL